MRGIIPPLPIRFHCTHKNNFTWSVSVYVYISFRVIHVCTSHGHYFSRILFEVVSF